MRHRIGIVLLAASLLLIEGASAAGAGAPRDILAVRYAVVDGRPLALDLHLPTPSPSPPVLVVYLHGGAWQNGDRTQYPTFLVDHGFAVASLDFRSTNDAPFPANVHDIKAGIRFLRAKAREYGYRSDRIAIAGASSGAHLAALVGVTAGSAELEGTEGDFPGESSRVQAIVSWFGASDLTTILAQSTPHGIAIRAPALQKLLGGSPEEKPQLARLASPVFHVDRDDPPLMLLHGDQDPQMPINQMHELEGAYTAAGLHVEMLVLHGVGHDAGPFFKGPPTERVVAFLKRSLGP